MLNSRLLLYFLLANLALLAANLWLFNGAGQVNGEYRDNSAESVDIAQAERDLAQSNRNKLAISSASKVQPITPLTQQSSAASASVAEPEVIKPVQSIATKQHQALQRLYKQQQAELKRLQLENSRLADKVSTLENQVLIKDEYLAQSVQREKQLNEQLSEQKQQKLVLNSAVSEIKNEIDQQPPLLTRQPAKSADGTTQQVVTDNVLADASVPVSPIETDIVSSLEDSSLAHEPFSGAIKFGFKYERDNQLTQGLHGQLILDYDETDHYHINSDLEFEFESEDKVSTTEKYRWQLQTDYHLDIQNIVFARSDLQRSKFASYEQEDVFTVGYGRIFINDEKHKFNTEVGPGYKFAVPNIPEEAVSMNEFILRTRLNYERILSESLQVSLEGVAEFGKANSVFTFEFKGQKRIYQELYLVFEFDYKYNENVPVDTEHDELSTGFSIMYAF